MLQALLFANVFSSKWKGLTNITDFELGVSIASACINTIVQTTKLYLEARACNEQIISYCLNMVMARIGWIPRATDLLALSRTNTTSSNTKTVAINYDIHYKICGTFKNKVDYLFSSITLRFV